MRISSPEFFKNLRETKYQQTILNEQIYAPVKFIDKHLN